MVRQRGFVLIIGLLLGVVILLIIYSSYSGFIGQYLKTDSEFGTPALKKPVVLSDVVVYQVRDNLTGDEQLGELGIFPVDVFDYRIKVIESDYQTYAEIMVENVGVGVYKEVRMGKGESQKIGNITLTVKDFISASCAVGEGC